MDLELDLVKQETVSFLDELDPDSLARVFTQTGDGGRVIMTEYIGKQPIERRESIETKIEHYSSLQGHWKVE